MIPPSWTVQKHYRDFVYVCVSVCVCVCVCVQCITHSVVQVQKQAVFGPGEVDGLGGRLRAVYLHLQLLSVFLWPERDGKLERERERERGRERER